MPRICENIKSRKLPDVQCKFAATNGDFCSRHWKHPCRFIKAKKQDEVCYTRSSHDAAKKIQQMWRCRAPFLRLFQQGPAATYRSISKNDTEIYSLDSVNMIPMVYYFSIVDTRHNLWCFDIRSLGQLLSVGTLRENPYTREPMTEKTIQMITSRIAWLRKRRYNILYPTGPEMTSDQIWKQKVLDLFMKIESFGFHVCCEWFYSMTNQQHQDFYTHLYDLWYYRLNLTNDERNAIVPGYRSKIANVCLFRYIPGQLKDYQTKSKHWWEKVNLYLIESFLSRAADKEAQKLGAMYCIMAFVAINEDAAAAFPWFVDS